MSLGAETARTLRVIAPLGATPTAAQELELIAGSNVTLTGVRVGARLELTIASTGGGGATDHGALTGLADDDHTQYLRLLGRAGGQSAYGGTAASEILHLYGTAHATVGYVHAHDSLVVGDPGTEGAGVDINGTTYTMTCRVSQIDGGRSGLQLHGHSTTYPIYLLGSRSNSDTSGHAAITTSMELLTILATGWTGSHYDQCASIELRSGAGTIGATSSPGEIRLRTTADSAQTPTTRVTIGSDGVVAVAGSMTLGTPLAAGQGGTSFSSYTAGDIPYATGATTLAKLGIGASGTILTSSGTAPQWTAPSAALTGSRVAEEFYGNGRDGALVADGAASIVVDGVTIAPTAGVYTLTGRDILATTLTLSDTVVLAMGGGGVRCLTLVGPASGAAYIQDNGANASGATAGAAPGAAGSTGRNAGAGATGRGTAGAGAAGSNVTRGIGGAGGAGGAAAGGSPAGGNGGTSTRTAADGSPHAGSGLLMLTPPSPVGAGYNGGGGGGAGGHDGVSGVSGGGGAGGGVVSVYAQTLGSNAANITIRANGGDGGNATGSDNGGGGPGGPGFARLVYDYGTSIPTVQANPGAVGTASGAGANGGAGASGSPQTRKLTV